MENIQSFQYHKAKKEYLEFFEFCRLQGKLITKQPLHDCPKTDFGAVQLNAAIGAISVERGMRLESMFPEYVSFKTPTIDDFRIYDETDDL